MDDLCQQFIKDIERDIDRFVKAYPSLPLTKERRISELQAKLQELYNKREYYRRAYNEVVGQLSTISLGLPDWLFSYGASACIENQDVEKDDEEGTESEVEPLSPDMLNFLLQTYRHREQREKEKAMAEVASTHFPPLVNNSINYGLENNPKSSKRMQLESQIANFYENLSECRNMPFWPIIPLRKVNR